MGNPVRTNQETVELLRAVVAQVMGVSTLSIADNFFQLGGDSLLAVELSLQMSQVIGREVSIREIFDAPDFATLFRRIIIEQPAPVD